MHIFKTCPDEPRYHPKTAYHLIFVGQLACCYEHNIFQKAVKQTERHTGYTFDRNAVKSISSKGHAVKHMI